MFTFPYSRASIGCRSGVDRQEWVDGSEQGRCINADGEGSGCLDCALFLTELSTPGNISIFKCYKNCIVHVFTKSSGQTTRRNELLKSYLVCP